MKSLVIRGARALGGKASNTVAQILKEIGAKQPEGKFKDIVADHLSESTQRLVSKLKGGEQKRKRYMAKSSSPQEPKGKDSALKFQDA